MSPRPSPAGTLRRWVEMSIIFIAFPIGLYFIRAIFAPLIVPTLLVTAAGCLLVLLRDPDFDRRHLGLHVSSKLESWRPILALILRRFIPGAVAISLIVAALRPDLLFSFPRREPGWWLVIMLAYPLLSVYPQELLFRTFFFHRYGSILKTQLACVLWSAFVFGLAHLFFANWIAPTLTAAGGYLFATTYARSGSTLLVSLEHALWGDFLFTIGLGYYFWGGSIRAMT